MSVGFIHFFTVSAGARPAQLSAALLHNGSGLRLYRCPKALCTALAASRAAHEPRLVMLAGSHSLNCKVARALRKVDPAVAVVALLGNIEDSTLMQAMQSGIDACWHDKAPLRLIVAGTERLMSQAACMRVLEPPSGTGGARWRLESRAWVVQAPGGVRITLTTAERAIMLALCSAPQHSLSHDEMLHIATGTVAVGASTPRRVSVLMSRLRRKFLAAGLDMPIRSVRGVGYELSGLFDESSMNR